MVALYNDDRFTEVDELYKGKRECMKQKLCFRGCLTALGWCGSDATVYTTMIIGYFSKAIPISITEQPIMCYFQEDVVAEKSISSPKQCRIMTFEGFGPDDGWALTIEEVEKSAFEVAVAGYP
ncbi:hypothetical protein GH714_006412 [Hevea brasiliensis]|uniref:Uncharacterized protein n=1 Tax=Hevea brasiliensis TaxID=3981 RepID=A0A6A6LHF3_HEVBR|nr:hypothetical protein GH714_006412 [Hevea brasiliensis]